MEMSKAQKIRIWRVVPPAGGKMTARDGNEEMLTTILAERVPGRG